MMLPPGQAIFWAHNLALGNQMNEPWTFEVCDDPGDPALIYSAQQVLTDLSQLRGEVLGKDLLSMGMLVGAARIGDMILTAVRQDTSRPLLQFAKHFRNACAHGDRWNFYPGEPKHLAQFGSITLSQAMNGTRATFDTVKPRTYVEFLDAIAAYFEVV